MKKILFTLLAVIFLAGALGGAGFVGYRIGYRQGASATGNTSPFIHGFQFAPRDMPMHDFGREFGRGFDRRSGPADFWMPRHGMNFGFFPPLIFLGQIAFWALVIWFAYWLFTRSGWQLSLKRQTVEDPKAGTVEPEQKTG